MSEDKEDETAYEGIEEIEEIIAEGVDQVQMLTLILPRGDGPCHAICLRALPSKLLACNV